MIRVQFNDKKTTTAIQDFEVLHDTVVLYGEKIPRSTAGFKAYRANGELLGDYSGYTILEEYTEEKVVLKEEKDENQLESTT